MCNAQVIIVRRAGARVIPQLRLQPCGFMVVVARPNKALCAPFFSLSIRAACVEVSLRGCSQRPRNGSIFAQLQLRTKDFAR